MKYQFPLVLLFYILLASSYQQPKSDTSEKMKQTLLSYFNGISEKDTMKMSANTTNDMIVYEEGKVWNNDSVFKEMRRERFKVSFKFDHFKIDESKDLGHVSYFEEADFIFRDTVKLNLFFLGSAAFRKTNEGWKMCFLHSDQRKK
jgi:hypothetical protein